MQAHVIVLHFTLLCLTDVGGFFKKQRLGFYKLKSKHSTSNEMQLSLCDTCCSVAVWKGTLSVSEVCLHFSSGNTEVCYYSQ